MAFTPEVMQAIDKRLRTLEAEVANRATQSQVGELAGQLRQEMSSMLDQRVNALSAIQAALNSLANMGNKDNAGKQTFRREGLHDLPGVCVPAPELHDRGPHIRG